LSLPLASSPMPDNKISVMIVCLGNICRSPMGEAVLAHQAKQRGLDIEVQSSGTADYHVGEEPDERTVAVCKSNGVPINHTAQQIGSADFNKFDYILASDQNNLTNLQRMQPKGSKAKVELWGAFDDGKPIQDPWYGDTASFKRVYEQVSRYSTKFLEKEFGPAEKITRSGAKF